MKKSSRGRSKRKSSKAKHKRKPSSGNGKPEGRGSKKRRSGGGKKDGFRSDRKQSKKRDFENGPGIKRLRATVDKNRKGFAFLAFDDRGYEDAHVPRREAGSLFHGDRVEVTVSGGDEVVGIKVIQHRFRELVGRFQWEAHHTPGKTPGWVIYERKKAREEVYIPDVKVPVKVGDWVRVKLTFNEDRAFNSVVGEIKEVYGQNLPPEADIAMVAGEFNLIEEHSPAAVKEAKSFKLDVPDHYEDLREMPFITIDGEDARDFDDAIYVENFESHFRLWVAIADVSEYVRHDTELDKEAYSRATSVYFPERAFHMLPKELSENLCSLRPNEDRLSLVAKIDFDAGGKVKRIQMQEAVIKSHRRATYKEIQEEWLENEKNESWEFRPHFQLYRLLRLHRENRGSIDFDFPETKVLCEPNGEVTSIKQHARLDAHRLIEEFMIAANEAATSWVMRRSWPMVYRVHEEPSYDALVRFQELARSVGIKLEISGEVEPKVLSSLVGRFKGHAAEPLLNMALLRSMKQAVYSSVHHMHYGLASKGYTHFTSPIRRYPDLAVHRLVKRMIKLDKEKKLKLSEEEFQLIEKGLDEMCLHASYRERLAVDAERESIKLKQVRLMTAHLGDEIEGTVNGMADKGLFIVLDDPFVEGMINRSSMVDDFYTYDEKNMTFSGKRKKQVFRIGDRVKIVVTRADIDERIIDFGLVERIGKK